MKKKVSILLISVLLACLVAACSGGGNSQQGKSGTAAASANDSGNGKASDPSEAGEASEATDETAHGDHAAETAGQTGAGSAISFETTDLDGNPVSSADIFSRNRLTMVNIWGTFCGPCINEMPDLEILNQRIGDKGCGLVGVVIDAGGDYQMAVIGAAEEIIADTGVSYLNLLPWEGIDEQFPAQYIPTTYFVDSKGNVVGEAAVGSRGADDYEALIDEALTAAGQ